MALKHKIFLALPDYKFTSHDIAEKIGIPTVMKNGLYETCPKVSRVLLHMCKEEILYQWIIGTGGGLDGMTYKSHKWELYYLKRDSSLARELLKNKNRRLVGYRIY